MTTDARRASSPLEILLLIASPADFPSWSREQQRDRNRRVLEWHDFIRARNPSQVPYVWGTHQLLSHTDLSPLNAMHAAVYRVESMAEYDELMLEDPLRDCSRYATFQLADLMHDHERDLARFNKIKSELFGNKDPASFPEYQKLRSLYTNAPDYVGKHKPQDPPNVPHDLSAKFSGESKLQVLIVETNTDGNQDFDDARQLIIYEKVLWWADYASKLITDGILTHGWTLHNFCNAVKFEAVREGAAAVYSVDSWEQFDSLYTLNPVRRAGQFWSVVLQPAQQQFEQDRRRYEVSLRR